MADGKKIVQISTAMTVQNDRIALALCALDDCGNVYIYEPPSPAHEEGWRKLPSAPWDQSPKPKFKPEEQETETESN